MLYCKSPAAYGVKSAATSMSYRHAAGQNQLHPGQALCLEVLSVWNGGFLVQLFIGLPRAYQGLLAPMQCHLQAYVGRTPCVHQMHCKFERLNWWSPPFLSQRMCGIMRVAPLGMTLWTCLTWLAMGQCLLWCVWPSAPRALNREGLVRRQSSAGSAAQDTWVCCRPASLEANPYWMGRGSVQDHLRTPALGTALWLITHINFSCFLPVLQQMENFVYE